MALDDGETDGAPPPDGDQPPPGVDVEPPPLTEEGETMPGLAESAGAELIGPDPGAAAPPAELPVQASSGDAWTGPTKAAGEPPSCMTTTAD